MPREQGLDQGHNSKEGYPYLGPWRYLAPGLDLKGKLCWIHRA